MRAVGDDESQVVTRSPALVGDVGYTLLLRLNGPVNLLRRLCGLGYWSLSAAVKKSVKKAVNFIGAFEKGIVQMAHEAGAEGVVCGHIHTPAIQTIEGVAYLNCGDWVESNSALFEHADGRLELIRDFPAEAATLAPLAEAAR